MNEVVKHVIEHVADFPDDPGGIPPAVSGIPPAVTAADLERLRKRMKIIEDNQKVIIEALTRHSLLGW